MPDKLVWQTEAEHGYALYYSENAADWTAVDGFPKTGTGGPMEQPFVAESRGFFKIVPTRPSPGEFVSISLGSFQMGDSFGEGESEELPRHTVHLKEFRMLTTEVTNDQMVTVLNWAYAMDRLIVDETTVKNAGGDSRELLDLDDSECRIVWNPATERFETKEPKGSGYPCVEVTWYGAAAWCNFRSEMDWREPCYSFNDWNCNFFADGYRLPTEAEWEKAARGGLDGKRFPWGDTISHDQANYSSTSDPDYDVSPTPGNHPAYITGGNPKTAPVGSFDPNDHGLYDMTGNVSEWCGDRFGGYPSSPPTENDPTGPSTGTNRVVRGGHWISDASSCRVAARISGTPEGSGSYRGFRPVSRPLEFVSVGPMTFSMGDAFGDGFYDELPVHDVYVSHFHMQSTEVTNGQMAAVLNWAYIQGKLTAGTATVENAGGDPRTLLELDAETCRIIWNSAAKRFETKDAKGDGFPCVEVTWYGCVAYCNYRSELDGLVPCYSLSDWSCNFSANGYRLPTEAEWEGAARGGLEGKRFPWGDTITHSQANYYAQTAGAHDPDPYDISPTVTHHPDWDDDPRPYTSRVGSFAPNGEGLYDMAGNVHEWCWDSYQDDYYSESHPINPTGPGGRSSAVYRGGYWGPYAHKCRVSHRGHSSPASTFDGKGFRPVRR